MCSITTETYPIVVGAASSRPLFEELTLTKQKTKVKGDESNMNETRNNQINQIVKNAETRITLHTHTHTHTHTHRCFYKTKINNGINKNINIEANNANNLIMVA